MRAQRLFAQLENRATAFSRLTDAQVRVIGVRFVSFLRRLPRLAGVDPTDRFENVIAAGIVKSNTLPHSRNRRVSGQPKDPLTSRMGCHSIWPKGQMPDLLPWLLVFLANTQQRRCFGRKGADYADAEVVRLDLQRQHAAGL